MSLRGNRFPEVESIRPSPGPNRASPECPWTSLVTLRSIVLERAMSLSRASCEPHSRELEPAQACATLDPSPATDRVDQHGEDAPRGWSAELSLRCVTVTGCRRRGAEGDIVAASCLHDLLDRVHNDLWLVDRYHVTGLSSDHQTSSF